MSRGVYPHVFWRSLRHSQNRGGSGKCGFFEKIGGAVGACSIDYKLLAQVVNERHKVYNICFVDFEKAFDRRCCSTDGRESPFMIYSLSQRQSFLSAL